MGGPRRGLPARSGASLRVAAPGGRDDGPTAAGLGGEGDDPEPVAAEGLDDVEEAVEGVRLGDVAVGSEVVGAADVVGDLGVGEDDDGQSADALVAGGADRGEDLVALDAGQVEVEDDEVPVEQAAVVEGVEGLLAVGEDLERGGGQALAEGDP